ncbi:MAG TPA: ATP-binding protein [Vicinamibacterales bacterium]|nr:ATP-binding protein [Vicinamibacterales bacterium]
MTQEGYTFLGLTAIVAALVSIVVFALLRFIAAARDTRRHARMSRGGETALMSAAIQEAVARLKAQERASLARAEASERLNTEIVASLNAGLLVVGLSGEVRILNPSGRRLLALDAPAPGANYETLLGEQSPLTAVIRECLATGGSIVRRALEMPEGSAASHLGVTASPLLDEHGRAAGAICLFSDLTAVMDLEEQLRLQDTLARLGELTAGLAHEFRNGLATIHGYARLIDPDRLQEKDRQYLEGLRQETDALQQVVANFLSFARPAQLAVSRVSLGTIVERAAEEIRSEITARGGEVVIEGEFGHVEGDDVLLRQAMSNLVRNAAEACAVCDRPPRILLAGRVDPEQRVSRVSVADNGPGIDPAVRDRIFRPFFTTKRDGTGLGLALVQKIIVTHNGKVTAGASRLGGASFEIVLPLAPGS